MRWKQIQHNSQSGAHSCERITNCTGEKPSYRARGQHTQAARTRTHTTQTRRGKRQKVPTVCDTVITTQEQKCQKSCKPEDKMCSPLIQVISHQANFDRPEPSVPYALCLFPLQRQVISHQVNFDGPAPSMPFSLCLFLLQRCLSAEQLSTCRSNPICPVQLTGHPLAPKLGLCIGEPQFSLVYLYNLGSSEDPHVLNPTPPQLLSIRKSQ